MTDFSRIPRLADSRRLTGGNLYWNRPAAIIDFHCVDDPQAFIEEWKAAADRLLSAVGREHEHTHVRLFEGGASILISAPIDVLYAMCDLNEVAFTMAQTAMTGDDDPDFDEQAQRLRQEFAAEANPDLLALQAAAEDHGVPFLWDDDHVSVGHGASAQTWTPDSLPTPDDVEWSRVRAIPVALVTGTNGKSTTVRMSAAILAAAGLEAGLTSTDWIRVGNVILDTGDYSGTGGARTLLRHPHTEVAVLETARGGLLRRGLGIDAASAALITNVAADHLGDYGINTVPELIEAKFVVRRALRGQSPLVLNADDEGIVAFAADLDLPIVWFSLNPHNSLVQSHRAGGGRGALLADDQICLVDGHHAEVIMDAKAIPATQGGAARYNTANALAAAALCRELGVETAFIRQGLVEFRGDESDNPGRGNWFEKDGVRILVDFAHNEHGMLALADMLRRIPARRRLMLMSQAGDRSDRDIRDMTRAACGITPDMLYLCELPGYERGREPGEVSSIIRASALEADVPDSAIEQLATPRDAVAAALDEAQPGDLLVLFVLTQREAALEMIHEYIDR